MTSLQDQVAIITGGGSGIGRGIALALALAGSRSVICGRRQASLDESLRLIREAGGSAIAVQADVAQEEAVDRLFKSALQAYGRLDIVINDAGISESANVHELDSATWDRVMATNLRGPFLVSRAALSIFRQQRRGQIINISSESGLNYYEGDVPYGISKHGLNALGEYTQRENQELGIRVNTICPGMVWTEMSESSPGLNREKCLYPEDIAELVLWLLTRRPNIKIGTPILIQTMENPWK